MYASVGLLALSVPIGTWIIDRGFLAISISQLSILLLIVVSLALYALGRGRLTRRTEMGQAMATFLFLFGVFFVFYGVYINYFAYDSARFHIYEPLVLHSWPFNVNAMWSSFLDMAWSSLWIIGGVIFVVDSLSLPTYGIGGAVLAVSALLFYWNWREFVGFFLGHSIFLSVSIIAGLLMAIGLTLFAIAIKKRLSNVPEGRTEGQSAKT